MINVQTINVNLPVLLQFNWHFDAPCCEIGSPKHLSVKLLVVQRKYFNVVLDGPSCQDVTIFPSDPRGYLDMLANPNTMRHYAQHEAER